MMMCHVDSASFCDYTAEPECSALHHHRRSDLKSAKFFDSPYLGAHSVCRPFKEQRKKFQSEEGKKTRNKKLRGIEIAREQQCSNNSLRYIIYTARENVETQL
jgi:hypothetical protein